MEGGGEDPVGKPDGHGLGREPVQHTHSGAVSDRPGRIKKLSGEGYVFDRPASRKLGRGPE